MVKNILLRWLILVPNHASKLAGTLQEESTWGNTE